MFVNPDLRLTVEQSDYEMERELGRGGMGVGFSRYHPPKKKRWSWEKVLAREYGCPDGAQPIASGETSGIAC